MFSCEAMGLGETRYKISSYLKLYFIHFRQLMKHWKANLKASTSLEEMHLCEGPDKLTSLMKERREEEVKKAQLPRGVLNPGLWAL